MSPWLLLFVGLLWLPDETSGAQTDLLSQGDAAFSRGEYTAAIRLYSSVIENDAKAPLLYTKRAAAYLSLRQMSNALKDFNKAIEVDSGYVQGYVNRGKLHRQICDVVAAERDFNKALELKAGHKTATKELEITKAVQELLNEVNSLYKAEQWDRLKPSLEKLSKESPECGIVQLMEAELQLHKSEYEQVIASTGRLLKAEPGNLKALLIRGQAYFYMNDNDMAKRHFGEALKYDPDYEAARKEFNRVKQFDRKRSYAESAASEGDWVTARNGFSDALHFDQKHRIANMGLWFGLCKAQFHLKEYDDAAKSCENVLIIDSSQKDAKILRVRALIESEKFEEAAVKAREAAQEHQGDHSVHEVLMEAEKRLKMSKRKDYYKLLGVDKSAGEREIKKAYRTLAMKYHPDKVAEEEKKASEEKFREIAEAYEVLADEEKRARYDAGEDIEQQGGGHHQGHPFFHQQQGQQFQFQFQWG